MALLEIDIHEYWHIGSGRGDGPKAHAGVSRTPEGLPRIPGRGIKGLLREAFTTLVQAGTMRLPPDRVVELFGSDVQSDVEKGKKDGPGRPHCRYRSQRGLLQFGNGELGDSEQARVSWRTWAAQHPERTLELFHSLTSTSINELGTVEAKSLRTIEVAVPMTLYARIDCLEDDDTWAEQIRAALPLVRAVGKHKSRGLGRCRMSLVEEA